MNTVFDFKGLFVLDLANNHQGNVEHGVRIINECGAAVRSLQAKGALKFQFRHLDTLIHPAHRTNSDNKHIPRFLQTALTDRDYSILTAEVKKAGLVTMATPFDEPSIQLIDDLDIDVIKIASSSALDWPLLERIAEFNKPVIVSTGGLSYKSVDDIVTFLDHRRVHFALMHCVSIYPTPPERLQLSNITALRNRHPNKVVGFSTHESPSSLEPVSIAIANGAEMLERHVGIETEEIELNAYSSTPEQIRDWIAAAKQAQSICGTDERVFTESENKALASLQRGIFALKAIKAGETVSRDSVYFAMPMEDGQLTAGEWSEGLVVVQSVNKDGGLFQDNVAIPKTFPNRVLIEAVHEIKSMLNQARIALATDFVLEFSHHYGTENFRKTGAILIECINRGYCKKLIIQLPGQSHPSHYHKRKEETFQVLSGILEAEVEGRERILYPGDILVVPQGVWHSFRTKVGVIFEEVSTTDYNHDSFYEDKLINQLEREQRKTRVSQWGRYQL